MATCGQSGPFGSSFACLIAGQLSSVSLGEAALGLSLPPSITFPSAGLCWLPGVAGRAVCCLWGRPGRNSVLAMGFQQEVVQILRPAPIPCDLLKGTRALSPARAEELHRISQTVFFGF